MIYKISILVVMVFISSCTNKTTENNNLKTITTSSTALIEVSELLKIIQQTNIKVIDFRKPKYYNQGHIANAVNIWRPAIENKSYPYKGMMASKTQIEKLFSNLGINTNDNLILYDDNGGCDSARLWWVLKYYNFTNVKLLNGGISSWVNEKHPITKNSPKITPTKFQLPTTTSTVLYSTKEEVLEMVTKKTAFILDTRTADEFSGKKQKKGAFKGGRIPNSTRLDWVNAIHYNGDKKFKSIAKLENIYKKLNVQKTDTILVYCHSGVRSAHTTFVLTQLLKYKNVKNYDGSWTEWSYFNNLPFIKDSLTKKEDN